MKDREHTKAFLSAHRDTLFEYLLHRSFSAERFSMKERSASFMLRLFHFMDISIFNIIEGVFKYLEQLRERLIQLYYFNFDSEFT